MKTNMLITRQSVFAAVALVLMTALLLHEPKLDRLFLAISEESGLPARPSEPEPEREPLEPSLHTHVERVSDAIARESAGRVASHPRNNDDRRRRMAPRRLSGLLAFAAGPSPAL